MYKKIKLNKDNILVFVLLLVAITPICINTQFAINDELWNFSNIYKMTNRFEIYKDLNVIITPLFFYVGELLFKILGANYLIFRIYNILIYTSLYFLMYRLFCVLKVEKKIAITYVVMMLIPTAMMFVQGANYNVMAFDFILLGVIWYIKYNDKRLKSNILQAIALYLIFMTKQNMGALYALGLIIVNIVMACSNKEKLKVEIKNRFLDLASIATIFIALVGIYVIYLVSTENLYNAIDFTILGIGEFTTNSINTSGLAIIVVIVLDILSMFFINIKKIKISKNIKLNTKILLSFAIPTLVIAYPLCNKYHVAVAIFISLIAILYLFEATFIKELFSGLNYSKIFKISIIIGVLIFFTASIIVYVKTPQEYDYKNPYYGSKITHEQTEQLDEICNYITNTDAKIISRKANFFMNILMQSNGILDLPFIGNFGSGGEQSLINKIESLESNTILIDTDKEFNLCSQDCKKTRQYIQENYKFVGEIGEFLIYQK